MHEVMHEERWTISCFGFTNFFQLSDMREVMQEERWGMSCFR